MSLNKKIAEIFYEISEYMEMENIPFKPAAYEKAANVIENMEEDIEAIYQKGGIKALEKIQGVGLSLAKKIEEFIKTNKIKTYEDFKKKYPIDFQGLRKVEGLGPQSIKKLYEKLKIKNLEDLKKAAEKQLIRNVPGFGEKSESKILKSLEFVNKSSNKFLLYKILPEIEKIKNNIKKIKGVETAIIAGSIRRMKNLVGDADILVISKSPKAVIEYFTKMDNVVKITSSGKTRASVKLESGINVDLRIVEKNSFGSALNYFTGSKAHNIRLREIAIKKGLKLNEYGIFKIFPNSKKEMKIGGKSEEEIYQILDMEYIEPELRENTGEIEMALNKKLPRLIGYEDLLGDLQTHTNWTDGSHSIEEMAKAAFHFGLKYIVITDHTKNLAMANGLNERKIIEQIKAIDRVNKKLEKEKIDFKILKGTEVDILKDGSLDIADDVLQKLDIVGASVHSYFNLNSEEQTKRIIKAMENPNVDIIFHPTGRILQKREAYDLDIEKIIKKASETGTILEADAYPDRLDLKDEYIKKCVEAKVKISIDSDSHSPAHFQYLKFGIAEARRGFASKEDVINAWDIKKIKDFLKK